MKTIVWNHLPNMPLVFQNSNIVAQSPILILLIYIFSFPQFKNNEILILSHVHYTFFCMV